MARPCCARNIAFANQTNLFSVLDDFDLQVRRDRRGARGPGRPFWLVQRHSHPFQQRGLAMVIPFASGKRRGKARAVGNVHVRQGPRPARRLLVLGYQAADQVYLRCVRRQNSVLIVQSLPQHASSSGSKHRAVGRRKEPGRDKYANLSCAIRKWTDCPLVS